MQIHWLGNSKRHDVLKNWQTAKYCTINGCIVSRRPQTPIRQTVFHVSCLKPITQVFFSTPAYSCGWCKRLWDWSHCGFLSSHWVPSVPKQVEGVRSWWKILRPSKSCLCYSINQCFLLSTSWETWPWGNLEAFHSGKPCYGTSNACQYFQSRYPESLSVLLLILTEYPLGLAISLAVLSIALTEFLPVFPMVLTEFLQGLLQFPETFPGCVLWQKWCVYRPANHEQEL